MLSDYLLRLKARASGTDTPTMKLLRMALVALLATGSAACVDQIKDLFDGGSPTSPTDPGAIRSYLPTHFNDAWIGLLSTPVQTDSMVRGAIAALSYAAVFGTLAFWRFLRKDVVS